MKKAWQKWEHFIVTKLWKEVNTHARQRYYAQFRRVTTADNEWRRKFFTRNAYKNAEFNDGAYEIEAPDRIRWYLLTVSNRMASHNNIQIHIGICQAYHHRRRNKKL